MPETAAKPTWDAYAADLAKRLAEHDSDFVTAFVVGVLGYAVENEDVGIDEHERSMCKHWLNRLVDEQGNPLDNLGRDAWQAAGEENALNFRGSLSSILREDDRAEMRIIVSRRAASLSREELRAKLVPHVESYAELLLDALYEEPTSGV